MSKKTIEIFGIINIIQANLDKANYTIRNNQITIEFSQNRTMAILKNLNIRLDQLIKVYYIKNK